MADVPEDIRAYFRKIAEEGDYPSKGGKARAAALTAEERSASAKKAVEARWKKTKKRAAAKAKKKGEK
jgi:hypothetical protein